jgi:hypothetical protein
MGYGTYSIDDSMARSVSYRSRTRAEIFSKREIEVSMKPDQALRECCDSPDHPTTIPIIIALDVTGSMGYVPERFVRDEMTKMMASLYESGLTDAQVLFMGIGDHECDRAPLQIGQFEADDQLLDKWLKDIYLESGGGGNDGESYLLAWYYASRRTKLDSLLKRGKKGFLFTIGDEHNLKSLPVHAQQKVFGSNGAYSSVSAEELLKEAQESYEVFHIHLTETGSGRRQEVQDGWKQALADHAIILSSHKEIAATISETVKKFSNQSTLQKLTEEVDSEEVIL